MVRTHKPSMLILLETKMTEHKGITKTLGFDRQLQFTAIRRSRGFVIIWKLTCCTLKIYPLPLKVSIPWSRYFLPLTIGFFLPFMLVHTTLIDYISGSLTTVAQNFNGDWFIGGDFNKVIQANEKWSGQNINSQRAESLRKCFNLCNMVDLGYKGSRYTWTNKRYKNRHHLIF